LDIVYEDDTLLLINKNQEWLFIGHETIRGTLFALHIILITPARRERPGLVHRIEKIPQDY
jgi:23S rRNA-/tRNA-specific pseudouridylate synthase